MLEKNGPHLRVVFGAALGFDFIHPLAFPNRLEFRHLQRDLIHQSAHILLGGSAGTRRSSREVMEFVQVGNHGHRQGRLRVVEHGVRKKRPASEGDGGERDPSDE